MRKLKNVIFKLVAIALPIAMVLTLFVGVLSPRAGASTDITASFTDPNFLAAVRGLASVPSLGPILASDVENIRALNLWSRGIRDLAGIEHFTDLERLDVSENRLTTLDLSNNPALTELRANQNALTTLNVSNNPELAVLRIGRNQLAALDVSNNPALITLSAEANNLTVLDVSNNPALTVISAWGNSLTAINVSNNPALISLNVGYNRLATINVSNNPALTSLELSENRLTTLDMSNNSELIELWASGNELTILNVSSSPALAELWISRNRLTTLNVSNNPALVFLGAWDNQLVALNVSNNPALESLHIGNNELTILDVSGNPALTNLGVWWNELSTLDVSNNSKLTSLSVGGNRLTELNVSNNLALTQLSAENNWLTTLDLRNNSILESLHVSNTGLTTLDVSNNPSLRTLSAERNRLPRLDISNNRALEILDVSANRLMRLDVSNNPALRMLNVERNYIRSVDMIIGVENTRLPTVDTSGTCPETFDFLSFRFSPGGYPWQSPQATNGFVDVPNAPHWQNDPVSWASMNGITQGIAGTFPRRFEPNRPLTREMFATFMFRVADQPWDWIEWEMRFDDTSNISSWATDAVRWAAGSGIMQGFANNTFRPQRNISREQIAVMLFRYAEYIETDTTFSSDVFDAFPDAEQVSDWAVDAMQWITYHRIITGQGNGNLAPQSNATRAEAVTMLQRFVETFNLPPVAQG